MPEKHVSTACKTGTSYRKFFRTTFQAWISSVWTMAVLSALSGCSAHYNGGVYNDGEVAYGVHVPGPEWREMKVEETDLAWFNEKYASALMVSSHCKGVDDAPLQALTRHLTIGLTEQKIESQEIFEWSGREAMETIVSAKMDGVPRKMIFMVIKKDACVYDLVLASPVSSFESGRAAFENLKKTFQIHVRPN